MSLAQFRELVGPCSDREIDRLRTRYKRYYREHRQVFTDLLLGKYEDDESFRRAALVARKTHKGGVLTRTSAAALARTNDRKFIKLAVRILYLRMIEDGGITAAAAKKKLIPIFERWGIGYDAIRKHHTPFQDMP